MAGQAGWMVGVRSRFEGLDKERLNEGLVVRAGGMLDYQHLARYHYRAGRPGTVRKVWTVQATERPPEVSDGATQGKTVGVLVVSMPVLSLRLREEALGGRYRRIKDAKTRAALINAEVRCISRVIVDPRWRGQGIAVRLVTHALEEAETVYTEAVAAMGAVHPFFERAGMRAYRRPGHEFDLRMKAALASVGMTLERIPGAEELAAKLGKLAEGKRRWVEAEMRRWMGRRRVAADKRGSTQIGENNGSAESAEKAEGRERNPTPEGVGVRGGEGGVDLAAWLEAARGALLAEPVYYVWRRDESTRGGRPGGWRPW